MKIYFAGSIRGGRDNKENYLKIINCLKNYGEVLTEHIGNQALDHLGERNISEGEIYKRDLKWLKEADVVIADVSTPSLGVGYEIAKAEEMGKNILCVCKKFEEGKKLSGMIVGNKNIDLEYYETISDIEHILVKFFKK
jgi:nucleoside 2-deoxyribosyltransferase